MHIFLDSNAIGVNFGFDSIHFDNLWDYIRRTESVLVIPEAVRTEVLATFDRLLDQRTKKAKSCWNDLHAILHLSQDFDEPDAQYEHEMLEDRLQSPNHSVESVNFSAQIDVMEVVRRGALRKRPANSNGEELRDVIIWLTALEYAKANSVPVVFVTADKGFWDDEHPHQSIQLDIQDSGVQIALYRDIESFVRANSLSEVVLSQKDSMVYLDPKLAASKALQWLATASTFWQIARLKGTDILQFDFLEGHLFEVDSNVQLAEISYRCRARLIATTSSEVIFNQPRVRFSGSIYDSATQQAELARVHRALTGLTTQPNLPGLVYGTVLPEPSFPSRGVVVNGTASFSVRIVNTQVEKIELDEFFVETSEDLRFESGGDRS